MYIIICHRQQYDNNVTLYQFFGKDNINNFIPANDKILLKSRD